MIIFINIIWENIFIYNYNNLFKIWKFSFYDKLFLSIIMIICLEYDILPYV